MFYSEAWTETIGHAARPWHVELSLNFCYAREKGMSGGFFSRSLQKSETWIKCVHVLFGNDMWSLEEDRLTWALSYDDYLQCLSAFPKCGTDYLPKEERVTLQTRSFQHKKPRRLFQPNSCSTHCSPNSQRSAPPYITNIFFKSTISNQLCDIGLSAGLCMVDIRFHNTQDFQENRRIYLF